MDRRSQAAVDEIIRAIESREEVVRKNLKGKDKPDKDRFMPGWAHGIHFSWSHILPERGWNNEGQNRITCFFEWNGIHVSEHRMEHDTDTDLTFLTSALFKEEMVPALEAWLAKKVEAEPYGGLYGDYFGITITLQTAREVRPDDPPHMQGANWDQTSVRAKDPKRTEVFKNKVYQFIEKEEYKTENLRDISSSLRRICSTASIDYLESFGLDYLKDFFSFLLAEAKNKSKYHWDFTGDIVDGFHSYTYNLINSREGTEPTENQLDLCCYEGMMMLMHGTDKYERGYGRDALKGAAGLGSLKAKEIIKYGTGTIPRDYTEYKDKLVTCTANDIDKTVDFKIKEESEEAYRAMVQFLIALMQQKFPEEYTIKFNSKVKEFLPIPDLKKTKASQFWNNCAKYPALFPLMKDYVRTVMNPYNYYSDASDEEAVPVGGYAVFALGLADASNTDIVKEFMDQNDSEHSISPSWFVGEYIDKFGVTRDNAAAVISCIINSNDHGYSGDNFGALDDPEILSVFVETINDEELEGYAVSILADAVWGGEKELGKAIEKAPEKNKALLREISDKAYTREDGE